MTVVSQHMVRCGGENWEHKKGPMSRVILNPGCGWMGKRSGRDGDQASEKPCPTCGGVVWVATPKAKRTREDKAQQRKLAMRIVP